MTVSPFLELLKLHHHNYHCHHHHQHPCYCFGMLVYSSSSMQRGKFEAKFSSQQFVSKSLFDITFNITVVLMIASSCTTVSHKHHPVLQVLFIELL